MVVTHLAQAVLAAVFLLHGVALLVLPTPIRQHLSETSPGGPAFFRFIGMAEILAAVGLTLPSWTGLMPWVVPFAAAGLLPIMAGAMILHLRRSFRAQAAADGLVLALVAAVTYVSR
jgi:DoxX-like protein